MIPKYIASAFPLDVRGRGDGYTDRVTMGGVTADGLVAIVRGTDSYVVKLRAEPDVLEVRCTCPYAIDNGVCKHIWATLKRADAEGKLSPILQTAGREAKIVDASGPFGEPRSAERATTPQLPEWKSLLDAARRQMAQAPAESESTTWPADRRIVYIVDLSATWTGGIKIDLAQIRAMAA